MLDLSGNDLNQDCEADDVTVCVMGASENGDDDGVNLVESL